MLLLPPQPGTCPICATAHDAKWPHNAHSIYYQYRFYGVRARWPTWADAIAHCDAEMKEFWQVELRKRNAWSEPADGQPIADPPGESFAQPIGDINSTGFGPNHDGGAS